MYAGTAKKFNDFQAVVAQKARENFFSAKISDETTLKQVRTFDVVASAVHIRSLSRGTWERLNTYVELTSIENVSILMKILFWVFTVLTFSAFYFITNAIVNGVLNDGENSKKIMDGLAVVVGIANVTALDGVLAMFFELVPTDAGDKMKASKPAPSTILAALAASDKPLDVDSDISDPAKLLGAISAAGVNVKEKAGAPTTFTAEQRELLKQLIPWSTYTAAVKEFALQEKEAATALRKYGVAQLKAKDGTLLDSTHGNFLAKSFLDKQKFTEKTTAVKAVLDPKFAAVIQKQDGSGPIGAPEFNAMLATIAKAVIEEAVIKGSNESTPVANVDQEMDGPARCVALGLNAMGMHCSLARDIEAGAVIPTANFAAVKAVLVALRGIANGMMTATWAAIEANGDYRAAIEAEKKTPSNEAYKTALGAVEEWRENLEKAETAFFPPIASAVATPTPKAI